MTTMRLHKDGAEKVALPSHPIHRAEDLTQGGNQALIVLHDQVYGLRITRAGKLILTK